MHIMLDLETLATDNNALIISIGAVKFDINGLGTSFLGVLDINKTDFTKFNFNLNPATILWWMRQSKEAQDHFTSDYAQANALPMKRLLEEFKCFMNSEDQWNTNGGKDLGKEVWGNGVNFDNAILRNAYEKLQIKCPWSYRDDRCFRTFINMFPREEYPNIEGVKHNPLYDAKRQALYLIKLCKKHNIGLKED